VTEIISPYGFVPMSRVRNRPILSTRAEEFLEMQSNETRLPIGETVTFDYAPSSGVLGTIVAHLDKDQVLVRWTDALVPTPHRSRSLKRADWSARRWQQ
jgi:hypothetical protein